MLVFSSFEGNKFNSIQFNEQIRCNYESIFFDILRSLYMHLAALLIVNVSCKLYIQNPCQPEISLVRITLCPINIKLVYLACEKLPHYIILSSMINRTRSVSK